MMPQNDGFALKSLQNYKNARAHFLAFGSKLTQSEEREKFTFPEVKHNAWLIHHSEKLAASLHGLMVQQTAAQHVDLGTTEAQQRGIVNAERVARSSSKNPHEHTRALNYHRASNTITTAARGHLNGALDGLELDEALKEESAKVEERKKKAAGEDLKRIEAELAEIEQFRKQLPKMREAIQEFTKQQIFEALSKEKLAKAARDAELGNASSETGLINDGYAQSEAQKKANSTRYIDIPVRFGGSNGKIALGVEDKYDAEGRVNRSFTIAAKHLTKHRLGLRPVGRLNSVGRHDLMRGIHEKMHEVNSETYNINFSELNVSTDDYQSYLEFLVTSLDISSEYLDQQFEASKNPPYTFSTNVIMHDGSVQSLDEFILKHSSWEGLWLLSTGQVRAIKLKNNTIGSKKTKLIVQKTDDIIAHAKVSDPSNKSMAARNAALEGTQLTVAAHNAIAQAFEKIDVIGSDVSLAAKAVQQLLSAKNAALAAHEKAKTLVHQAEVELNRQLVAHTASTAKSPELTELETLVKEANYKLRETEVALVKLEEVTQQFHDAFDATKFVDRLTLEELAEIVVTLESNEKTKLVTKINSSISVVSARIAISDLNKIDTAKAALEKLDPLNIKKLRNYIVDLRGKARADALKIGLGDRNTAIQALTPVVGLHAPSVEGIAKILWAADNNNPPTTAEINAACDEFKAATPATKVERINRAFDFNAKDTMKALTAAYYTVKGPLRDPAKVAAMVVDGRPAAETEAVFELDRPVAAGVLALHVGYRAKAEAVIRHNEDTLDAAKGILAANNAGAEAVICHNNDTLDAAKVILAVNDVGAEAVVCYSDFTRDIAADLINHHVDSVCNIFSDADDEVVATLLAEMDVKTVDNQTFDQCLESAKAELSDSATRNEAIRRLAEDQDTDFKRKDKIFILLNTPGVFAKVTEAALRQVIIKGVLNVRGAFARVTDAALRAEIIRSVLLVPGAFVKVTDAALRQAILESVLNVPGAFTKVTDPDIRKAVIAATIAKHPNNPGIQAIIKNLMISADPLAISSNASIDALALVVAGDDAINSMLVEILADARAAVPARRVLTRIDAINEANGEIAANPAAALRRGLLHNPAVGLSILNVAYEAANTTPEATAALIAAVPAAFAAIKDIKAGDFPDQNYDLQDPGVQKKLAKIIKENPAGQAGDGVRAIIDRTRAIANPASIGEALIRDPLLQGSLANTSLSAGTAHCVGEVKKAKEDVKVNKLAMSIHEAEKSAHVASALVDPAAAIATRKMMIGALTRVVSASRGNAAADAAALAVIAATDAEVWAELVLEDHDVARRTAIARCVPNPPAANAAAALLMLNNREQAKIALKAALDSNDLRVVNAVCKGIRNVLLAIIPEVNRADKIRIAFDAESNPAEVLTVVSRNHAAKMNSAITAEVAGLSEKAVRDMAKVDLAVCALILSDTAPAAPAAPAVPDKLLSEIAKWVPNPPAEGTTSADRFAAAKEMLRGKDRVTTAEQALRAALAAHPVEAQAAINAAIDGATLTSVLVDVKARIAANPFAAIDAHPLVKAARDHFVAHLPEVMVAKDELRQAREDARVTAEINRSENSAALKQALTSDFASLYLEEVTRLIQKEDGMRQAMGEHIPALLDSKVSGARMALALANAKPEDLMDAFTDPRVKKLSMTPGVFPPTYPLIALQTAINEHIADGDVALNEAVEKDMAVIAARNALETVSNAAARSPAFNTDPGVQQARAEVTYGAHVREVQEKCHQQLTTRPKSITFENGVVTFTPVDQSGQSQAPITLSAEDARDEVNKVLQGYTRYFEEVERAYNERLSDADKTLEATKNSEFGEGAIERVSEAMDSLKALEMLDPAVKANIEQAEAFLSELRRGESPLERLFNVAEVDKAKKEVEAAQKVVTTLTTDIKGLRDTLPASIVNAASATTQSQIAGAGGQSAVTAAKEIVGDSITAALITDRMITQEDPLPEVESAIQNARMQAYVSFIQGNQGVKNALLDQSAGRAGKLRAAIADARQAMGRGDPEVDTARAKVRADIIEGDIKVKRALGGGDAITIREARAEAEKLIDPADIENNPEVIAAVNKYLDKSCGAAWKSIVDQDKGVMGMEASLLAAQDNIATKQAAALKITEQVKTKMALDDPKTSKLIKSSEAIRQVPEKAKESGEDLTLKHKTLEQQKQTYAAKAADAFHAVTSSVSRSMGF